MGNVSFQQVELAMLTLSPIWPLSVVSCNDLCLWSNTLSFYLLLSDDFSEDGLSASVF